MELDNPDDEETRGAMRGVNERIDSLRGLQEDYRGMEKRVSDEQLRLEVQKRQLVRKIDEWVDGFVREGLVERREE